jgi:hypothetical protein
MNEGVDFHEQFVDTFNVSFTICRTSFLHRSLQCSLQAVMLRLYCLVHTKAGTVIAIPCYLPTMTTIESADFSSHVQHEAHQRYSILALTVPLIATRITSCAPVCVLSNGQLLSLTED